MASLVVFLSQPEIPNHSLVNAFIYHSHHRAHAVRRPSGRRTACGFPSGLPYRGFVHFPLQRRDVGEGAEQVGVIQAVAHRFLTGDPPQMAERAASLSHAVEWGELQLQNLRGWRINFGIRHEFHELA